MSFIRKAIILMSLVAVLGCVSSSDEVLKPDFLTENIWRITSNKGGVKITEDIAFVFRRDRKLILLNELERKGVRWSFADNRLSLWIADINSDTAQEYRYVITKFVGDYFVLSLAEDGSDAWLGNTTIELKRIRKPSDDLLKKDFWILDRVAPPLVLPDENTLDQKVYLKFDETGNNDLRISGYSGINNYLGNYNLRNSVRFNITMGAISSTKILGSNSSFENLYLARLQQVDYYVIYEDKLYLFGKGTPFFRFKWGKSTSF